MKQNKHTLTIDGKNNIWEKSNRSTIVIRIQCKPFNAMKRPLQMLQQKKRIIYSENKQQFIKTNPLAQWGEREKELKRKFSTIELINKNRNEQKQALHKCKKNGSVIMCALFVRSLLFSLDRNKYSCISRFQWKCTRNCKFNSTKTQRNH